MTLDPRPSDAPVPSFTCFQGERLVAQGALVAVASALQALRVAGDTQALLVFDDATGRSLDIDTRGSETEMLARLAASAGSVTAPAAPEPESPPTTDTGAPSAEVRGRGRPKLGVVPREVTLLPRHWDWLASQPGGASVALRKLVEEARRASAEKDRMRLAHERAYHFMSALAGDLPGFEEASRALFANDRDEFVQRVAAWPDDIQAHARSLGFGDGARTSAR